MFAIFSFPFLNCHDQLEVTNDFRSGLPREVVVQIYFPEPSCSWADQSMWSQREGEGILWVEEWNGTSLGSQMGFPLQLCYAPTLWPRSSHLTALRLFLTGMTRPNLLTLSGCCETPHQEEQWEMPCTKPTHVPATAPSLLLTVLLRYTLYIVECTHSKYTT